jgi:hypothetical protein
MRINLDNWVETLKKAKAEEEIRSALQMLMESELRMTPDRTYAVAIWSVSDVHDINNKVELTDEQAESVLEYMEHRADASEGMNWDVLEDAITYLFPEQPTRE